jgi:uncharacterized protein (TIGR02246 family)
LTVPLADPVQQQVDAFNAHDLDAFLACHAPDVVARHGDGRVLMQGHEEIREAYRGFFADPTLHVRIENRLRAGEWTVDEERVTVGDRNMHALVGFQVKDGLIHTVVVLSSDM